MGPADYSNSALYYRVEDVQLLCAGQTDFTVWLRNQGQRIINNKRGIYRRYIDGSLYVIGSVAMSYVMDTSVEAYNEFEPNVVVLENLRSRDWFENEKIKVNSVISFEDYRVELDCEPASAVSMALEQVIAQHERPTISQ